MVEVEVREDERNLLGFEDIVEGIVDTLHMVEEAYYQGGVCIFVFVQGCQGIREFHC